MTTAANAVANVVAVSKQQASLDALRSALNIREAELGTKAVVEVAGKKLVVRVAEVWPVIEIGPGGGFELPQVRSYPKADLVTMAYADRLLAKQIARDAGKAGVKAAEVVPPAAEAAKQTPTETKAKQHEELEKTIEESSKKMKKVA